MKELDPSLQLQPPLPADPFLPAQGLTPIAWAGIGIASFALITLLILAFRSRRSSPPGTTAYSPEHYLRIAREALEKTPLHPIQAAATHVSLSLRHYLAAVSKDPALFETHEEFVARHEALKNYSVENRELTQTLFHRLARLKYGSNPVGDPQSLVSDARNLLEQLHQQRPTA